MYIPFRVTCTQLGRLLLITNSTPRQSAVKSESIHERVLRRVWHPRQCFLVRFSAGRTTHVAIMKDLAPRLSNQLIVEKCRNMLSGGGNLDCMSFPIKGYDSSDPKAWLKLDELIAGMRSAEKRLHERVG
ncbi:hypothetical protein ARMSODRAFT_103183 [Armillaria solidipes]|uniref:Uncharacterized protein n=1 Tax=Armillaria solidipes TaxID=1076256 RepID=A0A2H3B2A0_9AGAR|nr:hypothetical protein ARMSODRAFT_103183 [Armillaria solidipes]